MCTTLYVVQDTPLSFILRPYLNPFKSIFDLFICYSQTHYATCCYQTHHATCCYQTHHTTCCYQTHHATCCYQTHHATCCYQTHRATYSFVGLRGILQCTYCRKCAYLYTLRYVTTCVCFPKGHKKNAN